MTRGTRSRLVIDDHCARHIFRDTEGHLKADTPANRRLLIETASRTENIVGNDRFGNTWFAVIQDDGSQVWVEVRGDKIVNGGVNPIPRRSVY